MSFTSVDIGFSERRYSFDAPNFGCAELDAISELDSTTLSDRCAACGLRNAENRGVSCASQELVSAARAIMLQMPTDTMGGPDRDDAPDSLGGDDEDENEKDEAEDDVDTVSGQVRTPSTLRMFVSVGRAQS